MQSWIMCTEHKVNLGIVRMDIGMVQIKKITDLAERLTQVCYTDRRRSRSADSSWSPRSHWTPAERPDFDCWVRSYSRTWSRTGWIQHWSDSNPLSPADESSSGHWTNNSNDTYIHSKLPSLIQTALYQYCHVYWNIMVGGQKARQRLFLQQMIFMKRFCWINSWYLRWSLLRGRKISRSDESKIELLCLILKLTSQWEQHPYGDGKLINREWKIDEPTIKQSLWGKQDAILSLLGHNL